MSKRLKYVDAVRGLAAMWMVFFQLFDMFSVVNIYHDLSWVQRFVGWFGIFIVVAGFSLRLAFEKYGDKTWDFFKKVSRRGIQLIFIGSIMTLICAFPIGFRILDMEILGAIGLNCIILCPLFLIDKIFKPKYIQILWFGSCCLIVLFLNEVIYWDAFFTVFWMQSFMLFGVCLAIVREYKGIWLIVGICLIALGLLNVDRVQYPVKTVERWATYCGIITLLLLFFSRVNIESVNKIFSYFGRHSLFFYITHYVIFQRLLMETDLIYSFKALEGIILAFVSVFVLVIIQYSYSRLRRYWRARCVGRNS